MRSIRSLVLGSTVLCTTALAQSISPSNSTDDFPRDTYPHFTVTPASSVRFPSFEIVPLAQYVAISRAYFVNVNLKSMLVAIDPQNVQQLRTNDFLYVSCDREDYTGELSPAQLLTLISGISSKSQVIFYTRRGIHCEPAGYMSSHLPKLTGVWTTLDPVIAGQVADRHFSHATDASATITAVQDTYTNPDSTFYTTGSLTYNPASSTAVAMIVLYTITGLITTLFVGIIVTGAIRAHLHPERYGPRARTNLHGRQSRAKGIARAVLETIPIVKFGDQHKDNLEKSHDMEMEVSVSDGKESKSNDTKGPTTASVPTPEKPEPISPSSPNADGTDELGALGCSICTEEFKQGEELRVLPCNHKYHPDCVDPWLLNVSGTCPLCRIDLRQPEDDTVNVDPIMLIPASTGNLLALRSATSGSRDERIAALRLFRAERSTRGENLRNQNEEERTSLARRLRDRFRIRTREHRTHHEATE